MATTAPELRAFRRVIGEVTARVSSEDRGVRFCRARDIGLGGCFLETDRILCVGDSCDIEIHLETPPRGPGHAVRGRAVRVEPGQGAAIQFTGMTLEFFDGLDQLLTAPRDLRWRDPPAPAPENPIPGGRFEVRPPPPISRSAPGSGTERARALFRRASTWAKHRWRG